MNEATPIYELHVKPTYAVVIPQRQPRERFKSQLQQKNEVNLKNNDNQGVISKKAASRLTNAVNWLVTSAKNKTIFDRNKNQNFNFRVNFVTLTIPTLDHNITDHFFKSVMLHAFINTLRYSHGMQNFVWKVEAQANGNIHAHFTTDCYIHWAQLRRVWNRILEKNGIIDIYARKHSEMSLENYVKYYSQSGKKSEAALRKAYDFGVSTNWRQPNSTDVHSVKSVRDLGAYLAKYMSKSDKERRKISGRLWSCSYNLSESNKLVIEMSHPEDFKYMECLMSDNIKYKPITTVSALTKQVYTVGEIFFFRMSDWGKHLRGVLLDAYNNHRMNIRTGVDVQALKASIQQIVKPPPKFTLDIFFPDFPQQIECPF